jgi:DNA-binding LacI/PurR family transcriptional regulator
VYSDNRRGFVELLDHVAAQGARTPCCILPPPTSSWAREISDGYRDWSRAHGVEPRVVQLADERTPEWVGRQIVDAAGIGSGVDAVICGPAGTALVALDVLRRNGVDIGGRVLLASYVDSDALLYTSPPITSIDLNPRLFGARCIEALVAVLASPADDDREPLTIEVPMSLQPRASTAGPVG